MAVQLDFGVIKIDIVNLVKSIHELTTTKLDDEAKKSLKILHAFAKWRPMIRRQPRRSADLSRR